ncbi:hypothetical protein MMC30_002013 [Trapelia coarctata]|nr:hypothetical protein [Trapelia coarctata]
MAYLPTPAPSHLRNRSTTPPLLSKRDKRRNAIEARIKEMNTSFTNHREAYSRAQLNALSRDINYINRADPYDTKPLEDYPDDAGAEGTVNSGENSNGLLRGQSETEARPLIGKWASKFVDSVNDSMELRDTELTEVVTRFQAKIEALKEEHDFAVAVSIEEHRSMKQSIRERAISLVHQKKRALEKEKALLDIADSNTLLLHPTQFTITQPASPGGAQSNRRTRHTRHRLDIEVPDTNGETSKRKRKAPADFDNASPGPAGRGSIDAGDVYYWDKEVAPALTINNLFGVKDIQSHTRNAIEAVGQSWAKRSKLSPAIQTTTNTQITNGPQDPDYLHTGTSHLASTILHPNTTDAEDVDMNTSTDPPSLTAPLMERGGSYATRSTLKHDTALTHIYDSFDGNKLEAMQCFGIAAMGAHAKAARVKDDVPLTGGLSAAEVVEDLEIFERAVEGGVY